MTTIRRHINIDEIADFSQYEDSDTYWPGIRKVKEKLNSNYTEIELTTSEINEVVSEESTNDLLSVLEIRATRSLSDHTMITEFASQYFDEDENLAESYGIETVKDNAKYDFFMENFDKISLEQLERIVGNG